MAFPSHTAKESLACFGQPSRIPSLHDGALLCHSEQLLHFRRRVATSSADVRPIVGRARVCVCVCAKRLDTRVVLDVRTGNVSNVRLPKIGAMTF